MITFSYSSMKTYSDCPKAWYFRYIQKVPQKPKHFFSFGKSMHTVLETFYDGPEPPSVDDLLRTYRKAWLTEGYQNPDQERDYFRQGEEIIGGYHAKHAESFVPALSTEFKFDKIEVGGIPVRGYIDRVDRCGDGISILDYKTGKPIPMGRLPGDEQLTMYQIACELCFGVPVRKLALYHLPTLTELPTNPRSEEQKTALKDKLRWVAKSVEEKKFDPTPGGRACGWCDYRSKCPAWNA